MSFQTENMRLESMGDRLTSHKISKYIDYPNVKVFFLSLQAEMEISFGNGGESLLIKRRQEQVAFSQASQAAAGKQQRTPSTKGI